MQGFMSENDLVNRARGEAFVGRRDELAQLASAGAEVAGSGHGQMVVIAGDAGVGKSRLVQEFSDQASRDGWTTAAGGCVDVAAGALTYAALIEIFRHLDRHLGREVMAKLAGAGIDDLAPLLPGVPGGQPGAGGRLLERMLDFLVRLGERGAGCGRGGGPSLGRQLDPGSDLIPGPQHPRGPRAAHRHVPRR